MKNKYSFITARKIIRAREKFAIEYCKKKNWPKKFEDLTMDQIKEIRNQEEWINPVIGE